LCPIWGRNALYEIESICRFAGLSLWVDALPDETTILNFSHLLEKQKLTEQLFAEIDARRQEYGALDGQRHPQA